MPGFDGTGPAGAGNMTGRGFGPCGGAGMGAGRGRRCAWAFEREPEERKEALMAQKKALAVRLEAIDKQLETL